jgi:hypothetical protein
MYFRQQQKEKQMNTNSRFHYVANTDVLLQSCSHYLQAEIKFSLYFIKYSSHWKMFRMNVVNINEMYLFMSRSNFGVMSHFLKNGDLFDQYTCVYVH